jgi:hypothetical protein
VLLDAAVLLLDLSLVLSVALLLLVSAGAAVSLLAAAAVAAFDSGLSNGAVYSSSVLSSIYNKTINCSACIVMQTS